MLYELSSPIFLRQSYNSNIVSDSNAQRAMTIYTHHHTAKTRANKILFCACFENSNVRIFNYSTGTFISLNL